MHKLDCRSQLDGFFFSSFHTSRVWDTDVSLGHQIRRGGRKPWRARDEGGGSREQKEESLSFRLQYRIRRIDLPRPVGTYPHHSWSRKTMGRCRRETDEDSPPTDVAQQRSPTNIANAFWSFSHVKKNIVWFCSHLTTHLPRPNARCQVEDLRRCQGAHMDVRPTNGPSPGRFHGKLYSNPICIYGACFGRREEAWTSTHYQHPSAITCHRHFYEQATALFEREDTVVSESPKLLNQFHPISPTKMLWLILLKLLFLLSEENTTVM